MNLLPAALPSAVRVTSLEETRSAVISGDVQIHPTANIANGVLLQAEPGSQIIIGAGACIGCGCILHVYSGTLCIEDGVVLGVGVLVFGASQIGAQSCIGSATSVVDMAIAPYTLLPANAWITSHGSSLDLPRAEPLAPEKSVPLPEPSPPVAASPPPTPLETPVPLPPVEVPDPKTAPEPPTIPVAPIVLSISAPIYGKAGLQRLLATLRNEKPDIS